MIKKICLMVILALTFIAVHAAAESTSGTCGESAYWSFDKGSSTLTIRGSGAAVVDTIGHGDYLSAETGWKEYDTLIERVVVDEGITSLGKAIFSFSNLKEIKLPQTLTYIDDFAFYGSGLKSIVIPSSVTGLGERAFRRCAELKSAVVSENITEIPGSCFSGCGLLESVRLSSHIRVIGSYAFSNCNSLNELDLPEGLTDIGANAFFYSGIDSIRLPDSLQNIYRNAFASSKLADIFIPAGVNMEQSAFDSCKLLKSVTIADGMESIPKYCFEGCSALQDINLPDSISEIGSYAFAYSGPNRIRLPENVKSISDELFLNCHELKEVFIPDGVTAIGTGAFEGCTSLEAIKLPQALTVMGTGVFSRCSALKELTLPPKLSIIPAKAFSGCGFKEFYVPDSVKKIYAKAFDRIDGLELHIPPSVTKIDANIISPSSVIYARPESYAYGYAAKNGYELREDYISRVGDVIDHIVPSDIYVTLNGELIPSYCISGVTVILIRDLENYGFNVSFDSASKTAYADFDPQKSIAPGGKVSLPNDEILFTDIRAIINETEVSCLNTNGYIAVEAERLGNYVPEISCVWQPKYRRLQMQAFNGMAHFDDLVNEIGARMGMTKTVGCEAFLDTDNSLYDEFTSRGYIYKNDFNGYVHPMRGLRMEDFILMAGRAYLEGKTYDVKFSDTISFSEYMTIPHYLDRYLNGMYANGILAANENGHIYLSGILTKEQMNYYLDLLESQEKQVV